jgi:Zn-dependent M28 family amino/carboxypeptidase
MKRALLTAIVSVPLSISLGAQAAPQTAAAQAPDLAPAKAAITADRILGHIKILASDEFEGRKPGSAGEEKTVTYLVEQFKKMGLKPGNTDGTYIQTVPLVGLTPEVGPLTFSKAGRAEQLAHKGDFVAWTRRVTDRVALEASEMIFVGYGVEAPEYQWNDFKDVDVKGKTIVVLVNDPPVRGPDGQLDPKVFGGKAMTYYGRWTYKFDKGAEKGATGIFVVHETEPAGYPWSVVQGFAGERFDLVTPNRNADKAAVEGWLSVERARQLFKHAGQDFDALKKAAVSRDFKPVPLGTTASVQLQVAQRTVDSRNVLAKVEGADPKLRDEYVIYTAHWDHLGKGDPVNGDVIYNGAKDNASGTAAMLEIARAFAAVKPAPPRTVIFLAVTAEEQGLLGSQYYATNPIYPLTRTLAAINIDGMNLWGRTKDITVVGMGASDLDDYLRKAAAQQGRELRPDPEPEKGFYYRSDHFNFARQGVPALYTDEGVEFIGKPESYGMEKREYYTANDYHQPSDEVKPDWDLAGAVEDSQLFFAVGYAVARADKYPEWKPGNEFRAMREKSLKGQ